MRAFGNPLGNPIQDGAGAGRGAAIGDIRYLLQNELTDGYLPPDGRRVYRSDYPGLAGVLREFQEGDTLNWLQSGGMPYDATSETLTLPDGRILAVCGATVVYMFTPNGAGGYTLSEINRGLGRQITSIAYANGLVALGYTSGIAILRVSDLSIVFNNSVWNSGRTIVRALAGRYFVLANIGAPQSYVMWVDTNAASLSATFLNTWESSSAYNFEFSSAVEDRGTLILAGRSGEQGGHFMTIAPAASGNGSLVVAGRRQFDPANNNRVPTACFVIPSIPALVSMHGFSTQEFYTFRLGAPGVVAAFSYVGALGFSANRLVYDGNTETLVTTGQDSQQSPRRIVGQKDGFVSSASLSSEVINFPGYPPGSAGYVGPSVNSDSQWAVLSIGVNDNASKLFRANTAGSKAAFNLPNAQIANRNDRADGRSPYVRVR